MPTLEQITQQVNAIQTKHNVKLDTFGTKKEFKALPEVLYEGEEIKYLTSGFLDGSTWMIVCTNKRIVALDKGLLYGMKQQDIPLDKISSVSFKKGLVMAEVEIITSSAKIKIEHLIKDQVNYFVSAINAAQEALKSPPPYVQAPPAAAPEKNTDDMDAIICGLEKLAKLKESGIITEEEFTAKKKQVLGI